MVHHQGYSFPVHINGGTINKEIFVELITEIFKYFLYERSQIPYPFERIDYIHKQDMVSSGLDGKIKPTSIYQANRNRNIESLLGFIRTMEQLFKSLTNLLLDIETDVLQVSFAFGANILMTKEVYTIEMPDQAVWKVDKECKCRSLTVKNCLNDFFQAIISSSIDNALKKRQELPITRTSLMVQLSNLDINSLRSRHGNVEIKQINNFRMPRSAKSYKFCPVLYCNCIKKRESAVFAIYQDETDSGMSFKEPTPKKPLNELSSWFQIGNTVKCIDYYLNKLSCTI